MKQTSFASLEYADKKRKIWREKFLGGMQQVVPWSASIALIEPDYPSCGGVGRLPIGVPRMLRMYFLQQSSSQGEECLEDAVHDRQGMRKFVGIELAREQLADVTTLLNFPGVLEENQLTRAILTIPEGPLKALTVLVEHKKAQIRALMEHPFHGLKHLFGYGKVSCCGLRKNDVRLYAQFTLANLMMVKGALLDEEHQSIGATCVRKERRTALNYALSRVRR